MEKIIKNSVFVVVSPRMPSAARSTGEGVKDGLRIEEVKQIVLSDALLRPLAAIKSRLRRVLARYAVPSGVMGNWIVPLNRWEALKEEIRVCKTEWDEAVEQAITNLPAALSGLCRDYPHQAAAIMANALDEKAFRKSCQLVYAAFRLDRQDLLEQDGLRRELAEIEETVVDEMGKMIRDAKRDTAKGCDASALSFLRSLAAKAQSFAFVGEAVARMAFQLKQASDILPADGPLTVVEQDLAVAVFKRLCCTEEVLVDGLDVSREIKAVVDSRQKPAVVQAVLPVQQPVKAADVKPKKVPMKKLVPDVPAEKPTASDDGARLWNNPVCI
ncbi:hypothetical protein KBW71_07465 [Hydrogenophaga aromaticivorans]|uniref:DUF3150 domain-containing protein n=1 Tax=Hydrogenophaga aromaticivorans TaxID=2610898 RepID=UPI001B367D8C|nr:DUF3150 domain-containing protein [Hydrogenophaga aromaticivorans]MBQ0918279.1 hypothetical protein [Hydrogenophaga aromaticivorans]